MRPATTRSPVYVLTAAVGSAVILVGWAMATVFESTVASLTTDVHHLVDLLPGRLEAAPATIAFGGLAAAAALVHLWLLEHRHFRRLVLVDAAAIAAVVSSLGAGHLLLWVSRPATRAVFDDAADRVLRGVPTGPAIAGAVAALVMVHPWLPARARLAVHSGAIVIVVAYSAIAGGDPYLGFALDVGIGMVAASLVALLCGTPNLQPDRDALIHGLAASGLDIADLRSADVDARGSEPWIGAAVTGEPVFVKALSVDQRAADLLFRALRWARLRRTGDAPPEASLRRVAEHEALLAHHARSLGIATPRVLAVAAVGPSRVALAYAGLVGRSLDKTDPARITDEVLRAVWEQVRLLRRHRIAHRDLRLANVFLTDDDQVFLIDFGFGELAASAQLLDTDVAELLAASSAVVGIERAVRVARDVVGVEGLDAARDWLHPLAFSTATRRAIGGTAGVDRLRAEVDRVTGHTLADYQPLGRLSSGHVLRVVFGAVGVYSLLAMVAHDEVADHLRDIDLGLLAVAIGVGLMIPVVDAATYRTAVGRRVPFSRACAASIAAMAPVSTPTPWAFSSRTLSDAARDGGVAAVPAKRAAFLRCISRLVAAPLLVAAFTTAGSRVARGDMAALGLGLAAGGLVAAAELGILLATRAGRELTRVWLRPFRSLAADDVGRFGPATWGAITTATQGTGFALAARAAGVGITFELLVAVGVGGIALAQLLPTPGGAGATELLTGIGLLVDSELGVAVLGAVLARVALFWAPLPVAMVAFHSTRSYRPTDRHTSVGDSPLGGRAGFTTRTARPSWWT